MRKTLLTTLVLGSLLLLVPAGGCRKTPKKDEWDPFKSEPAEAVLLVEIEQTPHFREWIQGDNPTAFKFIMQVIDRFEAAFPGGNAQVILGEICERSPEESILWQGTVAQLRKHFHSARQFNQFLSNRQNPGARVYENLETMLRYAMRLPGVREGKTKIASVVLSSMADKSQNPTEARQKLVEVLREYRQMRFAMGFYWVDMRETDRVDAILHEAGYPVTSWAQIVEMPPLPNFEN